MCLRSCMDLQSLTLAAVLSLARGPAVDVATERPRLEALAHAIAGAVEQRAALDDWLPGSVLPLPGTPERSALALVAIAYHESAFRADVSDCRTVGFAEPSITAFQLHGPWSWGGHTRRELCADVRLAASRALYVLARQSARCRSIERGFWGYASGNCGRSTKAAREIIAIWRRLLRERISG